MTSLRNRIFAVAALGTLVLVPPAVHAAGKKSKTSKAEAPPAPKADAAPEASTAGTVVDAITSSKDHSTLLAAIKAAGLDGALTGPGPFTIFAPSNAAFERLPAGTVDTLLKPENRGQLSAILASHVIAGSVSAADLAGQIQAGGGTATLTTATGAQLKATMEGTNIVISDGGAVMAKVTGADMKQGNGMVHSIDGVLQPKVPAPAASPAPDTPPPGAPPAPSGPEAPPTAPPPPEAPPAPPPEPR